MLVLESGAEDWCQALRAGAELKPGVVIEAGTGPGMRLEPEAEARA